MNIIKERLAKIIKRLKLVRKETDKKTKEIGKKIEPIKPFIKDAQKETLWIKKILKKIMGFQEKK